MFEDFTPTPPPLTHRILSKEKGIFSPRITPYLKLIHPQTPLPPTKKNHFEFQLLGRLSIIYFGNRSGVYKLRHLFFQIASNFKCFVNFYFLLFSLQNVDKKPVGTVFFFR